MGGGGGGGTMPGPAGGGVPCGGGTPPGPAGGGYPAGGVPCQVQPGGEGYPAGGGGGYPARGGGGGGYPGRTTEGVLNTRRAVCLLCSRRRTFLFTDAITEPVTIFSKTTIILKFVNGCTFVPISVWFCSSCSTACSI